MQEKLAQSQKQLQAWDATTKQLSVASLAVTGVSVPVAAYSTLESQPEGILAGYTLAGTGIVWFGCSLIIGRLISEKLNAIATEMKLGEQRYSQGKASGQKEAEQQYQHQLQKRDREWEERTTEQLAQQRQELEDRLNSLQQSLEATLAQKEEKIIQLRESIAAARTEGELEATRQNERQLTNLKEELELARNRVRRVEDLKRENEQLSFALSTRQQMLDSKEDLLRQRELQHIQNGAKVEQIVENNRSLQQMVATLERQIELREQEIAAIVESTRHEAVRETQEKVANQYQLELEKANAISSRLKAELSVYRRRENLDKELPELRHLIVKGNKPILKPSFLVGDQGSGKALHAVELARLYSLGANCVIAVALDISEGGREDSSWARLGVPVTGDRSAFFRLLKAVKKQLDNPQSSLPFRNQKEHYWQSPPILLFIDEALTSFAGMEKEELVEIAEAIRAIETRGSKRKVFLIALSTNDQIQNLSPEGKGAKGGTQAVKIWNTGTLNSYLQIYLNDAAKALVTDEELKANLGLQHYLAAYGEGYFISAAKWIDGKGKFLKPFKHVSHHGHLLTETLPSRATEAIQLAPCPSFFTPEIQKIYARYEAAKEDDKLSDGEADECRPGRDGGDGYDGTREKLQQLYDMDSVEPSPTEETASPPGSGKVTVCPRCESSDLRKNGKRQKVRQRWKCKNCGYEFTET